MSLYVCLGHECDMPYVPFLLLYVLQKGGGGPLKGPEREGQSKSHGFLLHSLINTQSSTSLSGNSIYRGFVQEEWVLLAPRAQASPIAI